MRPLGILIPKCKIKDHHMLELLCNVGCGDVFTQCISLLRNFCVKQATNIGLAKAAYKVTTQSM